MVRQIYPNDKYRIDISLSKSQMAHFHAKVPRGQRREAVRRALIEAGLIPAEENSKVRKGRPPKAMA